MTDGFALLDEEDVQRVVRLIESLDKSEFDFLELKVGDLEVILGKGDRPGTAPVVAGPAASPAPAAVSAPAAPAPAASQAPASVAPGPDGETASAAASDLSGTEVAAPLMGVFYAQPEPGAAPFVTVGSEVKADTTVALIEVMKTFAPVPAGVDGVVVEVCVTDSQFVEFGQTLLRIEPSGQTG